jgi:hypothetical protein
MKMVPSIRGLTFGVTLFTLGIGTTLVAQTLTDSPQRVEKSAPTCLARRGWR